MRAGREAGPRPALPWLAVGLVVVAVSWFGLSNGMLERVGSSAPRANVAGALPVATPTPSVARTVPMPGQGEAETPLGHPPYVARSRKPYKFMVKQSDGRRPVAYDPCRSVHFVIRPKGAPPGGRALVVQAISRISAATGLTFVDDGSTREAPSAKRRPYQPRRYGDRWAPVLIAWQTSRENPDFASDVAGEAGSAPVAVTGRDTVYVTGQVQLDTTKIGNWLERGGSVAARTLIMHELGHLVGLDHVRDPSQVMYPEVSPEVPYFGLGDRRGLAALGRGSCAPYL